MTFAQRIARILELKGESRASLVKRTGISKTALNDFLAGRTDPSFTTTVALIKAFPEYNARHLLTGVSKKPKTAKPKEPELVPELAPGRSIANLIERGKKTLEQYKHHRFIDGKIARDLGFLNMWAVEDIDIELMNGSANIKGSIT